MADQSRSQWVDRLQYAGLRVLSAGFHLIGKRLSLMLVRLIARVVFGLFKSLRLRTIRNVQRCFPEFSEQESRQVAVRSVEHFLQLGVEVFFLPDVMRDHAWRRHVTVDEQNLLVRQTTELLRSKRPVLLIAGHLGNWEVMGFLLALWGFDVTALARPIDNPLINKWLLDQRQLRGLTVLTKWGATDEMVSVLQAGGALGFVADQNAGRKGMFVPFFGQMASTYKSIALLAMQFDAAIVCGVARRTGDFRFHVEVEDLITPESWADAPDPLYYITARYVRAIEFMVRKWPEQYLWNHRRWRTRPMYEKAGKPMPASVEKKLLQLPWMTEELLESCRQPVPDGKE